MRRLMIGGRVRRLAAGFAVSAAALAPNPAAAQGPRQDGGSDGGEVRTYALDRAVSIALQNNRQLNVTELELARAGKLVREAYGALFPSVSAEAGVQRNLKVPEVFLPAAIFDPSRPPGELVPVRFGADNQWTAELNLKQKLFDAGVFIGVGAAGKVRDLNEETVRRSAQRVATGIRVAYLNILLAEERVRVTRNSIERVEKTLAETRALYGAGLASDYDVLRLEVQLANIQPNLRRSLDALAEAQRELGIEMGLGEVERVGAEGQLHEIDLDHPEANSPENRALLEFTGLDDPESARPEDLYGVAGERRADLREARAQWELEDLQVKVARTELFPRLDAFFSYEVLAQENGGLSFFGETPNQRTTTASVGVQIEVPVFAGGSRWSRVEQRKLARRQAEERIADLELRVRSELHTVRAQVDEARHRARAQREAVDQARRGFEIARSEFLAGTGARLEVTDAELALRQAELNYAQAVYDYLVARARLDEAVGVVPQVETYFGVDELAPWSTVDGFGRSRSGGRERTLAASSVPSEERAGE